ncbi:rhodanese-related sulfurtransferase [Xenococcus sp. PCC 7305]|uniref:sulfurtransferase n=1 Tax=Xenococcus sp. PCC 7305 TaxID=102125 RepID=UPI0002AC492D|nr:sulfurtransferase [Xenococcus sp. PCC 7305]ELS02041.1 rhodanese-related sulfurtransferase [Xenococcus sp. PCC 7305]
MLKEKVIVDSQWLLENLENPLLVIIDCRFQLADPSWGQKEYDYGHIQGAHYLNLDQDLSSKVQSHGGRHPLPNIQNFAAKLESIGIVKNQSLVVVYDDSRFAFAARLWWLLRYLGHNTVSLLDGGWNGWKNMGYPISTNRPQTSQGNFCPQVQNDWTVDIEKVKGCQESAASVVLVDSRDRDRYEGKREPIDPIAGSIPGALNSPWKQVSTTEGYLKPLDYQEQLWSDYQSASEIIVYCGSGVTACVNLLSLELAGFTNTKLYPGGWSDYISY